MNVVDVKKKVDNKKRTVTSNSNQTKKEKIEVIKSNQKLKRSALKRRKKLRLASNKFFLNRTTTELKALKIDFFKKLKYVKKQQDNYVPNKIVIYYNKSPHKILYSILFPYILWLLYKNTHYILNINDYWDDLQKIHDEIKERDPQFNPKALYEVDRDLYITAKFRRVIYFGIILWTLMLSFIIYLVLHYVMEGLCDNIIEFNSYCIFRIILTGIFVITAFVFHYYLNPILIVSARICLHLIFYSIYFVTMLVTYICTFIMYVIGWIFKTIGKLKDKITKPEKSEGDTEEDTEEDKGSFFDAFKLEKSTDTQETDESSSGGFDKFRQIFSMNTKKQTKTEQKQDSTLSNMINNIKDFSIKDFINNKKEEYFNPKLKKEEEPDDGELDNISGIKDAGDFFKGSLKGFDQTDNKKSKTETSNMKIETPDIKIEKEEEEKSPKKIRIRDGCKTNMIEDFFLQFKEERLNKDKNILTCIQNKKIRKDNQTITDKCKPDKLEKANIDNSKINIKKSKKSKKSKKKFGTKPRCERQTDFTIVLGNFFKILHNEYVNGSENAVEWYIERKLMGDYKKVIKGKRIPKYLTDFENLILIGVEQLLKIMKTVKKAARYGPKQANKEIEKFKEDLLNTKDKNRRSNIVNKHIEELFIALDEYMKGNTGLMDRINMNKSFELSLIGRRILKVMDESGSDKATLRAHIDFLKEDLKKNFITRTRFEIIKPKFTPVLKELFKLANAYFVDEIKEKDPGRFIDKIMKEHSMILSKKYLSVEITDLEKFIFFGILEFSNIIERVKKQNGKKNKKTELYVIETRLRFSKKKNKRTKEENVFIKKHIEILKEEYVNNKIGASKLLRDYDDEYDNSLNSMFFYMYIINQRVLHGYKIYGNNGAQMQIELLKSELKKNFIVKKEDDIKQKDENETKRTPYIEMYPSINEFLEKLKTIYINEGKDAFKNKYLMELINEYQLDFSPGSLSKIEQLIFFININKIEDILERLEDISQYGSEKAYKFINIIKTELTEDFENEINKSVLLQSQIIKLLDTMEDDIINSTDNTLILRNENDVFSEAKENKSFMEISNLIVLRVYKAVKLGKDIGISEVKFLRQETETLITKIDPYITKKTITKKNKLSPYNEELLIAMRSEYLENNKGAIDELGKNLFFTYLETLSADNYSIELSDLEKLIFYVGEDRLDNYFKSLRLMKTKNRSVDDIAKRINEIEEELTNGVANVIDIFKKYIIKLLNLFKEYYVDNKKDAIENAIKQNNIIKNIWRSEVGELLEKRMKATYKIEGKEGIKRQISVLKQEFNKIIINHE